MNTEQLTMNSIPQFSGKVYADRSFSIGIIPRKSKSKADTSYDREYEQQFDSAIKITKKYGRTQVEKLTWLDGTYATRKFIRSSELSQERKKYGKNGITRYGKRVVKNSAILLERKYGIKRLGFVTATIPNLDASAIDVVCKNWALVIKKFFQKLKRHLEKLSQPMELICCTEIQEKRYKKYGVIAPHLHFIYVCKSRAHTKKFNILANILRRYWEDSIRQVLEKSGIKISSNVSFKASINAQVIKKSAAGYIAKYMSKGGEIIDELEEKGLSDQLPSQWWTASKSMKKMFQESIIKLDHGTAKAIFYGLGDCLAEGWLTWCNYISITIGDRDVNVGCVGVFSEEHYYLLQS